MSTQSGDDPYRRLEDDSPETLAWQAEQNALAEERLVGWPGYERLREAIAPHAAALDVSAPVPAGGRWFRVASSALIVSDEPGAPGSVVFQTSDSLDCAYPSPDARHVVFGVSRGGDEQTELGVLETDTGRVLPERFRFASFARVAWLSDSSGFYYNAGTARDPEEAQKWLYLHRLGDAATPQAEPVRVRREYACPQVSADGRYVAAISSETEPRPEFVGEVGSGEWRPFLRDFAGVFVGGFVGSDYVALTYDGAPRGRVVAIPVDGGSWRELVPESDAVLRSLTPTGEALVLGELVDGYARIRILSSDGRPQEEVPLPGLGAVGTTPGWGHSPLDPMVVAGDGELTFVYSSLLSPPRAFRYRLGTGRLDQLGSARGDLDGIVAQRLSCTSRDGTRIPFWLVHRRGLDLTRSRPTLVYGYGGWNVAFVPSSIGVLAPFVEAGGILALPNLRGGGEYGWSWWEQGRLAQKQNTFDDLYATAEALIAAGTTSPDHLAVAGASNGGLLAAAACVQRPELFRAVVSLVPLTDMLRFGRDSYGCEMSEDYGDPGDPQAAQVLRAYSPYHNVRDGERYPATLVVCGENDIRCPPWHGRKLAARLQHANSGDRPVLLRVWPDAGHLAATAGHPGRAAEWLGFVMAELGLEPASQ
ncbi:MAG TPA: prolyl oligopeptidase family serine peptidase [Gaiellaceae bacterium]